MEAFSALLALCVANSPVTGEFPSQRPVMRRFDVFFGLRLNKWLSKQSMHRWFETLSSSLWRHCNDPSSELTVRLNHVLLSVSIISSIIIGLDNRQCPDWHRSINHLNKFWPIVNWTVCGRTAVKFESKYERLSIRCIYIVMSEKHRSSRSGLDIFKKKTTRSL